MTEFPGEHGWAGLASLGPTSHAKSVSTGPPGFLCRLLRAITQGTRKSEFQSVQRPVRHSQKLLLRLRRSCIVIPREWMFSLSGTVFLLSLQTWSASSQHSSAPEFLTFFLCFFPCLEGSMPCWSQAAFKHFFPLKNLSNIYLFCFQPLK